MGVSSISSHKRAALSSITVWALDAAVQDIKTVILNEGRISADGISNIIDRSNAVVAFVKQYFPNAAGSSVITDKVQATLEELNICEDNLLYAQSVCPDEINHHREGCITTNFIDAIGSGKCFHLGGVSEKKQLLLLTPSTMTRTLPF